MSTTRNTAGRASSPDPAPDQDGKPVPERIAEILGILQVLLAYGRHLALTLERRAAAPGFATIAQFFGTAAVSVIRLHLHRGLSRAMALERVLLQRAARGRDLVVPAPGDRPGDARRAEAPPDPGAAAATPPAEATAAPTPATPQATAWQAARLPIRRRDPNQPPTVLTMPTLAQLEAEVRHRPIGRTIADICRDLGIAPSLCAGPFWNRLFFACRFYRGSLGNFIQEMRRREKRFEQDAWRYPALALPEPARDGIRRTLGFRVGEPPCDPLELLPMAGPTVATAATGPP